MAETRRDSTTISGSHLSDIDDVACGYGGFSEGVDDADELGVARGCVDDVVGPEVAADGERETRHFSNDRLLAPEAARRRRWKRRGGVECEGTVSVGLGGAEGLGEAVVACDSAYVIQ